MKRIVIVLVFIVSVVVAKAQDKSPSELNLHYSVEGYGEAKGFLMLKDTIVEEYVIEMGYNAWELDEQWDGNYTFVVKSHDEVKAIFKDIILKPGCRAIYDFKLGRDVDCEDDEYVGYEIMPVETAVSLMYGNQNISPDPSSVPNEMFTGSVSGNLFLNTTKYCSQYFNVGGRIGYTDFTGDTSEFEGIKVKDKRYTSLNFHLGFFNRFSFFNMKKYSLRNSGFYIDLGVMYNLPLINRQILVLSDNTRLQTRSFHKFNDFSGVVRIVYKFIGVQAEYNPYSYLFKGYAPNPAFRLGLIVSIVSE